MRDKVLHYTFNWSGPWNYINIREDIDDLIVAGCYILIITDTTTNCSIDTTICINDDTGIFEQNSEKSQIKIYPSPVSKNLVLNFKLSGYAEVEIEIIDISGKILISTNKLSNENIIPIDVNHLTPGLYFVIITNEIGSYYKKLVISK